MQEVNFEQFECLNKIKSISGSEANFVLMYGFINKGFKEDYKPLMDFTLDEISNIILNGYCLREKKLKDNEYLIVSKYKKEEVKTMYEIMKEDYEKTGCKMAINFCNGISYTLSELQIKIDGINN